MRLLHKEVLHQVSLIFTFHVLEVMSASPHVVCVSCRYRPAVVSCFPDRRIFTEVLRYWATRWLTSRLVTREVVSSTIHCAPVAQ